MGKISDAARIGAGPPPGERRYDRCEILRDLTEAITRLRFEANDKGRLARGCKDLVDALDRCSGQTLQDRWTSFEQTIWPKWRAGEDRNPTHRWMWGARVIVMARFVRPSWEWIAWVHMPRWVARLPSGDPLLDQHDRLAKAVELITWAGPLVQLRAVSNGLRMLLVRGYASISELTEEDLKAIPPQSTGTDVLDAALCSLGVFNRTPQRGPTRRHRRSRHTIAHLVAMADIAEPFRAVTELYMEVYSTRISDLYNTQRQKVSALGHFWRFIAHRYPKSPVAPKCFQFMGAYLLPTLSSELASWDAEENITKPRRVSQRMPGFSTCAYSLPTSAPGQPSPTLRLLPLHLAPCPWHGMTFEVWTTRRPVNST